MDIRVVLGMVGYEMVDVVVILPPAQAEAADPVGNECTENAIRDGAACDSRVSGVVSDD